ncbi:hypothetical protein C2S51_018580 [Perilla frutescens var. frutescens]|nr:hypothetical protein C2S51_018580 [Perilla frutescens var. frutescens]
MFMELLSQQDQLDHSAAYIEFLRERVEQLRRIRTELANTDTITNYVQPILRVKELDCGVEVVLMISGVVKNFRLHDVITIIEEEAAEVLTVNISTTDDMIIHTIHAQVKIMRVGVDTARISERINHLISST